LCLVLGADFGTEGNKGNEDVEFMIIIAIRSISLPIICLIHSFWRFEGANLRGAHLEGANLRGTHLEGADLSGAQLSHSDQVSFYVHASERGKEEDFIFSRVVGFRFGAVKHCPVPGVFFCASRRIDYFLASSFFQRA
jgi:uncharacterized protein YjbI with pentapeptide repeats